MSIKIASMNFGDCDTILHNTPNGMKNIAEVLGPNGEVYWSSIKELTGIPPLSIRSNGTMLLDYLISGNMTQTGTPTPENPVMPQGTGERTGNLFNADSVYGTYKQSDGSYRTKMTTFYVINSKIFTENDIGKTFTYSINITEINGSINVRCKAIINGEIVSGTRRSNVGEISLTFTVQTVNDSIGVDYGSNGDRYITFDDIMVVEGSSVPSSYIPFGYKIPISSGGENLCPDTGWRSGQYRDGVWETTNTRSTSDFFPVSSNQYRLKINTGQLISFINFNYFDNQKQWLGNRTTLGMSTFSPTAQNIVIPQLPSNAAYMSITIRFYNDNGNPPIPQSFIDDSNIMVNEGTSEPSYEPYNRTTTPIYLGEVEATRRVKKLVFDGTENWGKDANLDNLDDYFYTDGIPGLSRSITPISSHFISGERDVVNSVWVGGTASNPRIVLEISKLYTGITSADDKATRIVKFKSYLAAQYAAGTPVTVWYVLATPTTGIVNEPLRKIGNYADTLSMEQAGVQIPTNRGNTVIDVETELKPSQMYIKYK